MVQKPMHWTPSNICSILNECMNEKMYCSSITNLLYYAFHEYSFHSEEHVECTKFGNDDMHRRDLQSYKMHTMRKRNVKI
jgi:hypothetical protein